MSIPKGWQIVEDQNLVEELLSSTKASYSNRFISIQGDNLYKNSPCYSGFEELERVDKEDGERKLSLNEGEFTFTNGIGYAVNSQGIVISQVKEGYYKTVTPIVGYETHDICPYCGASNGEHGELRQGYDCYHCGSN